MTITPRTFIVFPPNRLSAGNVLINQEGHRDLYNFLDRSFYDQFKGQRMNKPYASTHLLLEWIDEAESVEVNGEDVISPDRYNLTSEDNITYSSLREYLGEVSSNFGPDTIVICSDYEG